MFTPDTALQRSVRALAEALARGAWEVPLANLERLVQPETWGDAGTGDPTGTGASGTLSTILRELRDGTLDAAAAAALLRGWLDAPRGLESEDSRWEPQGVLGVGGMGEVRAVYDRRLGRQIAQKTLRESLPSPRALERFLLEARVTAQLEHPNIPPVHDLTYADDRPILSMKQVLGRTLDQQLPTLDLDARLEVLTRVCDAVAYAHSRGVVHRDLKPANVMVGAFGEVLVMDWGLATSHPEGGPAAPKGSVPSGVIAGTPAYMAPEQARGEVTGPRADVYALGALLYELTCDRAPFSGRPVEVLERVRAGAVPPPSEAPRELRAVILRAMAARVDDRFPDVSALRSEVSRFRQGLELESVQYGAVERLGKWGWRHRRSVLPAATVAAVALVLGLLALWVYNGRLGEARDLAVSEAVRARGAERDALERALEAELARATAQMGAGSLLEARAGFEAAAQLAGELGVPPAAAELGLAELARRSPPAWTVLSGVGAGALYPGPEPDTLLCTRHLSGRADVIRVPEGERLCSVDLPGPVRDAALVSGEVLVASADGSSVRLIELCSGAVRAVLDAGFVPNRVHLAGGHDLVLASSGDRRAAWDLTGVPRPWPLSDDARADGLSRRGDHWVAVDAAGARVLDAAGAVLARFDRVLDGRGDWILAIDDQRRLTAWNAARGGVVWASAEPTTAEAGRISEAGLVAVSGFEDAVEIVFLETGTAALTLASPRPMGMAWVGRVLWVSGIDDTLRGFPVPERPTWPGIHGMGVSPDGQLVALASTSAHNVVFEPRTSRVLRSLVGPEQGSRDASFSPDGRRVALAGRDGSAWVYDLVSGARIAKLEPGEVLLSSARWIDDDHLLLGGASGTLRLWTLAGEVAKVVAHAPGPLWEIEVDGDRAITTGRHNQDTSVAMWSLPALTEVARWPNPTNVYRGALRGGRAVWGLHQGQLRITDGGEPREWEALDGPVLGVDFRGGLILTTGWGGRSRVWSEAGERLLDVDPFEGAGVEAAVLADGRRMLAAGVDGRVWDLDLDLPDRLTALREVGERGSPERLAALGESLVIRGLEPEGVALLNRAQAAGADLDPVQAAWAARGRHDPAALARALAGAVESGAMSEGTAEVISATAGSHGP